MPILTGKRIREVYVANRKLVPENIELEYDKNYELIVEENMIRIYSEAEMVYFCKFKINKEG